jgi:signal transduction histidine kinase
MYGERMPLPRAIVAGGTIVAMLVVALGVGAILKLRSDALLDAKREVVNVARMVSDRIEQTVAAADFALVRLTDDIEDLGVQTPAELAARLSNRAFYDRLMLIQSSVGQVEVVTIVDAEGKVLASSRGFPAPSFNLADRPYLHQLRDNPERQLALSGPLRNRYNGGWVFYIARPLRSANGEFLGVAVAGVAASWVERGFATIDAGADTATALFTADNVLVARWPHVESAIGNQAPAGDLQLDAPGLGRVRGLDGKLRLATGRALESYPLVVAVSRSVDGALADWRSTTVLIAGAIVASLAIILALTRTGLKLARRDARTAASLAEREVQLSTAIRAKSDFLSNMSHELRSPLTVIIGFAKLIDRQTRGPAPAEYSVWARDIMASAEHLLALVNDILDLSKIEAGALELDESPTSLLSVLRSAIRMHKPQAEEAGVTLELDEQSADVPVLADERRLLQIAINLVTNAIKYTPNGGSVTVELGMTPAGEPRFAVADTGIGIAPEDIERVMARFVQLKAAGARRSGGSGIGLPLARELVELHGGRLVLSSEQGKGTCAEVILPFARVLAPPRAAAAS